MKRIIQKHNIISHKDNRGELQKVYDSKSLTQLIDIKEVFITKGNHKIDEEILSKIEKRLLNLFGNGFFLILLISIISLRIDSHLIPVFNFSVSISSIMSKKSS